MDFISVHEYQRNTEYPYVLEVRREVTIRINSIVIIEDGIDCFDKSSFSVEVQQRFGIGSRNSRILTDEKDENGNIIYLNVCESHETIKNKIKESGQHSVS